MTKYLLVGLGKWLNEEDTGVVGVFDTYADALAYMRKLHVRDKGRCFVKHRDRVIVEYNCDGCRRD